MSNTNNGGPAFPCDHIVDDDGLSLASGMTLRDYFAAKAMQALTSNMDLSYDETAEMAYEQADAMLKARQS